MSNNNSALPSNQSSNSNPSAPIQAEPLQISASPETGALLTSPLFSILSLTLSSCYQDLYDMTNDEISVVVKKNATQSSSNEDEANEGLESENNVDAAMTLSTEKMSSLPFTQRRFELCSRIAKHSQSIKHAAALLALPDIYTTCVQDSSAALEHVHSAWIQADEAQDSLYFAHSKLFFARKWCFDLYGALNLICGGSWKGFPKDVELNVDHYETSHEKERSVEEVKLRLQCAVRKKLVESLSHENLPWSRTILEKGGGVVQLRFWEEAEKSMITARLTVLSEEDDAEWTLLSIDTDIEPKIGESHHQLQTNNRQKFDLHRLCMRTMAVEEARTRKKKKELQEQNNSENGKNEYTLLPNPLDCLFEVAHTFSLSQQIEILSAQAEALKRGEIWIDLQTFPVHFFEKYEGREKDIIALTAVYFWNCDDRFGTPLISDLTLDQHQDMQIDETSSITSRKSFSYKTHWDTLASSSNRKKYSQKLSLCVTVRKRKGIVVSLSGAASIINKINDTASENNESTTFLKRNVDKITHFIQNPFYLSMSDALLACTLVCSHMRCLASVHAIKKHAAATAKYSHILKWMKLRVDCATIDVAVKINYHNSAKGNFLTVLRIGIDSRSGRFISLLSSSWTLLRSLICNDSSASYIHEFRVANAAQGGSSKKRILSEKLNQQLTGRITKDLFDGMHRSFDILGSRVGLGESTWENENDESQKLRDRIVFSCVQDSLKSLSVCAGVCVLFGFVSNVLNVVFGVDSVVDMAGNILDKTSISSDITSDLIPIPPLSVLLQQKICSAPDGKIRENGSTAKNTERKKSNNPGKTDYCVIRNLVGAATSIDSENGIIVHFLDIVTKVDSIFSVPTRTKCSSMSLFQDDEAPSPPAQKKIKLDPDETTTPDDKFAVINEIEYLSSILMKKIPIKNIKT